MVFSLCCAYLGSNLLFLEGQLLYWIRAQPNDPIPGFPGGSVVKNLPANARDAGLIPGLGRSSGGGNGNVLHYSCLDKPQQRFKNKKTTRTKRLMGCSLWGCKKLGMT